MSIFKETFRPFVFNQLQLRQEIIKSAESTSLGRFGSPKIEYQGSLGQGTDNQANTLTAQLPPGAFYTNTVERQCIISMKSGVNLREDHNLNLDPVYEKNLEGSNLAERWVMTSGVFGKIPIRFFNPSLLLPFLPPT